MRTFISDASELKIGPRDLAFEASDALACLPGHERANHLDQGRFPNESSLYLGRKIIHCRVES